VSFCSSTNTFEGAMKIAVISKSDRIGGGASRVAEDMAIWLNEAGYPTDHFITFTHSNNLHIQQSLYGTGFNLNLCQKTHAITQKFGFRELLPVEYWFNLSQVLENYDTVHFHDLYTAISPLTLALTARRKLTFFTVHDCSAFTGGCLYPMSCNKFVSHCHQCPQLPQNRLKDRLSDHTREIQTIKQWISKNSLVHYIFPSDWMAQQADLALTFKLPPVIIPNGLDLRPFTFLDKKQAKVSLAIPTDRPVVVISAHFLNDTRKGIGYALAALQSVSDLSPFIVAVGHCNEDLRQALQGLEVKEMGFITDRSLMAHVYSASDIMLFCSLADNLPLTVLEAMAASAVVIGFATGGVPEMIQSDLNGILVESKNQEALNQALRQAMLSPKLEAMGQQARKDVENHFSSALFLERHLQLYAEAKAF
jgi:glycosyltransferase involved in cell wall biosynthesis